MAGGRGERFWPSSREDLPKQFLAFDGERTLLQRTVDRLTGIAASGDVWIVTREDFAGLVSEQVPAVPARQVLLEPQGRDTAPCLALAALHISKVDPDAVMLVLPADHLILQAERFREALAAAISVAASGDHLVTFGVRPTRPETGYGYIKIGALNGMNGLHEVYKIAAFTEKPPREQAMAYIQEGGHFWNSGIFIWKVSSILRALQGHLPALMEALKPLAAAIGTACEQEVLRRVYPLLPKTSIDYGVMERAENTVVIPVDFGWDDLGTWAALERVALPDLDGNIIRGRVLAVDTKNSVIQSAKNRLLVTFGLSNIVVVDSEDAVLVADKSRVSDLKAVVGRLEAEGLEQHLRRPRIGRPVEER
jgi:mannose-1-phosphate guanylyltransferase